MVLQRCPSKLLRVPRGAAGPGLCLGLPAPSVHLQPCVCACARVSASVCACAGVTAPVLCCLLALPGDSPPVATNILFSTIYPNSYGI